MKVSKKARIASGVKIRYEAPAIITGALNVKRGFQIGAYSYMRSGLITRLGEIGRYCSIGPNVIIGETEHPLDWLSTSPFQYSQAWRRKHFRMMEELDETAASGDADKPCFPDLAPVSIGHDVWIGANVLVRCGVTIGTGAVCAAGAIVTKDVAPYTIVGGVSAKPIRTRFDDHTISELLELQWWRYDAADLMNLPFHDVKASIVALKKRIDGGLVPREFIYKTKKWENTPAASD